MNIDIFNKFLGSNADQLFRRAAFDGSFWQ